MKEIKYLGWLGAIIIFVLLVAAIISRNNEPSAKKEVEKDKFADVKLESGWSVTPDIARDCSSMAVFIVTDPYNQKFIVVQRGSSVSMLPYTIPAK
jgi:hypothetical protein